MNSDISPDVPDAVSFYERYVALCERLGVTPVTPERARELVETWDAMFEGAAATKQ